MKLADLKPPSNPPGEHGATDETLVNTGRN